MRSLAAALQELSFDPLHARVLGDRGPAEVDELAGWLAAGDPYRENRRIGQALAAVGGDSGPDAVRRVLAHQLWCAWRQARWTAGAARPLPTTQVVGAEWLAETAGHPTVLVSPLTVPAPDALHAVAEVFGDRPLVAFGEDTSSAELPAGVRVPVVSEGSGALRRILATLADGGVLCTYPDFVYPGRGVEPVTLFGRRRPISAGFVSLAARPGTMLLPAVLHRRGDRLVLRLEEPLLVGDRPADRASARAGLRQVLADVLAALISRAPEQWLLLPTLTFDSPQLAPLPAAGR
ncbi:hypothetical protein MRQ36_08945 [Micromonospora sp. R77]|uniref:hypothetical protein n=1 Tax=Micromonospora sp. R77 TaxID=2925836 RepID=UPI001F612916|nr:hypothetical protein [Micromonospora sp. R77]MCI4062691.1 hypothetical protein [Micromonospora sp. R77]